MEKCRVSMGFGMFGDLIDRDAGLDLQRGHQGLGRWISAPALDRPEHAQS